MHQIVKLPDTGYRISGQNVTSDIRLDIREGDFFESDIKHFPDIRPDSEKVSSKKKTYREKNCVLH